MINSRNMLKNALANKYAIPQFNINNLEWTKYILEECEANNSPVIIGVSEGAIRYMGGYKTVYNVVVGLIYDLNISIPVVLHLDHGSSFLSCKKAIDEGFTSVMIDASKYDINENIRITKEVTEYAQNYDVTVEAEVGHVGGKEGVANVDYYATLEDCRLLVDGTGIDSLAPALGSVHGLYKGEPNLDFERMEKISKELNIPLVLHGGTGIPDKDIKHSIECGMTKININTEFQVEWNKAVRKYIVENPDIYDPRKIIGSGEENIKTVVRNKIKLLGSDNKV